MSECDGHLNLLKAPPPGYRQQHVSERDSEGNDVKRSPYRVCVRVE